MAILHNSTFTGTAGTAVNLLTPDVGNALVNVTAAATTDGTRMRRPNTVGIIRIRTADAFGTADYAVTCVVHSLASSTPNDFRIGGRYADIDNYYYVDFVQSLGQLRLRKRVAGVESTLTGGTGTYTWSAFAHATDYSITLRMEGSSITGWLDGTQVISGTDTAITAAGEAFVFLSGGTGSTPDTQAFRVDSLVVEDFAAGGPSAAAIRRYRTLCNLTK